MMAQGYVDGRMAQAGIAPVISRCNIRDDRNERKLNSQLDLDGRRHGWPCLRFPNIIAAHYESSVPSPCPNNKEGR